MKRCTACFHYSLGDPTFCTHCGRSYDAKICARGHVNPRGVLYCAECGSGELSTPGPPAGFLFTLSQWTLRVFLIVGIAIAVLSMVVSVLYSLDWSAIAPHLFALVLMLAFLYWTTTLLPGPVRRVGRTVGKHAWKAMTRSRKKK